MALGLAIVGLFYVNNLNWDHAQISGTYRGWLDNAATGKTGVLVYLQQVGEQVSGNCTLSRVYAFKQTTREGLIQGHVKGPQVTLQADLKGGGVLFLSGRPGSPGAPYKIVGMSHFEGTKDSSADSPFMIQKIPRP
jgi:hypothetical protein